MIYGVRVSLFFFPWERGGLEVLVAGHPLEGKADGCEFEGGDQEEGCSFQEE